MNKSEDIEIPGCESFAKQRLHFYSSTARRILSVDLMLPMTSALEEYANDSFAKASSAEAEQTKTMESTDEPDDDQDTDSRGFLKRSLPKDKEPELTHAERQAKEKADAQKKEATALQDRFEIDVASNSDGHLYQVHAPQAPLVLIGATRMADKDRNTAIFNELKTKGAFRPLSSISVDRFESVFDDLERSHPLFSEVIAFVKISMALALKRGVPQRVPPMLLVGPPGLGKTHFSKSIAAAMGTEFHLQSYDSNHKSSALMGQDKGWANSTPGIVFDAVIGSNCANPLIVLDEVDKCNEQIYGQYQHPLAALHSLLEPVTSKQVEDICTELVFDASLVTWICTANRLEAIPQTIVTRLKVFHIHPPSDAALALDMAQIMLHKTYELMALSDFDRPSNTLASLIAHLSPREQRQELEFAFANAVSAGRTSLRSSDFSHLDTSQEEMKSANKLHLH